MMDGFQIRVTGILLQDGHLLLVRQRVSATRAWSLPGGRVEAGETLAEAMAREMREETGLEVAVGDLLYLCEVPDAGPPLLHITFALAQTGGSLRLPTNELDSNPIGDVRFVPVDALVSLGFSQRFVRLIRDDFPGRGRYIGSKAAIGL